MVQHKAVKLIAQAEMGVSECRSAWASNLKSPRSSNALQDCRAVFGGIKVFLPRQGGVDIAMLSGCIDWVIKFLPWRSAVCLTTQFYTVASCQGIWNCL